MSSPSFGGAPSAAGRPALEHDPEKWVPVFGEDHAPRRPREPMSAKPTYARIAFVASPVPEAQEARQRLAKRYGDSPLDTADVIVALGGDGLMLQTLHRLMGSSRPIYGMHRGPVGLMMNEFREDGLAERLAAAETAVIHPLVMRARDVDRREYEHRAINEVSLFRQIYQAARLRILIDGKE